MRLLILPLALLVTLPAFAQDAADLEPTAQEPTGTVEQPVEGADPDDEISAEEQATLDEVMSQFPYDVFQQNVEVASWLLAYDRAAWLSTDVLMQKYTGLMERLGPIWFCGEKGESWVCTYGNYDDERDRYEPVIHLTEQDEGWDQVETGLDSEIEERLARAIRRAWGHVPPGISQGEIRFNIYARPLEGEQYEVWFLPAQQPDGRIAFGVELRFVFDAEGELVDREQHGENLMVGMPDPEAIVRVDNTFNDCPTSGQLFFLFSVRRQVDMIYIDSKDFVSTLFEADGQEAWLHTHRDMLEEDDSDGDEAEDVSAEPAEAPGESGSPAGGF